MQILTTNNIVLFHGTVEKGTYPADPSRELYKITNDNGEFYAVTEGFTLHEVEALPSDYADMKYCYTETDGFTLNPNWVDPNAPTQEEINKANIEYLALMTDVELLEV